MIAPHQPERVDLISALIDYVEQLSLDGVTDLEVSPETLRRLNPQGGTSPVVSAPPAPATSSASPDPVLAQPSSLDAIARQVASCTRCPLCRTRNKTVPGQGHSRPALMFVGEGPGADEDAQGLAFVGRAGRLLTDIITAMGLTRDEVFIGNIVKCRPPNNRPPTPEEMAACIPYLKQQIALLQPKVIVALGATAAKGLFGEQKDGISKLRGTWQSYESIPVMPTYHPAYLLRNPPAKKFVWADMKNVLTRLGLPIPPPRKTS